ncbi:TRAP transporter substrate-binding protein [Bacillus sp. AK128]
MKKAIRSLSIVVTVFLLLLVAACGNEGGSGNSESANESGETTVLKVAFNQPENHPQYKAIEELGKKLEERTNGAYKIELYPNELLGAQRETMELVQSGTIAMSVVVGGLLENLNQDFVVFNLPYVFDNKDHQMSVINDPAIVGDLYKSLESEKMSVLGAFHGGVRNVYNKEKPIHTPEDLAGLKIRIIESDTNIEMMELMGGTGTPMGQGEVYTAIQSGVLDGGENNELIFSNLKHVEIAPYYSYTQHLMFPDYLIMNTELLNGMSEEHREILEEELAAAIDQEVEMWDQEVEVAKKAAEEAGAKFNEVDITLFQDAVRPLVEEKLTTDTAKELYEKVRAAAK